MSVECVHSMIRCKFVAELLSQLDPCKCVGLCDSGEIEERYQRTLPFTLVCVWIFHDICLG